MRSQHCNCVCGLWRFSMFQFIKPNQFFTCCAILIQFYRRGRDTFLRISAQPIPKSRWNRVTFSLNLINLVDFNFLQNFKLFSFLFHLADKLRISAQAGLGNASYLLRRERYWELRLGRTPACPKPNKPNWGGAAAGWALGSQLQLPNKTQTEKKREKIWIILIFGPKRIVRNSVYFGGLVMTFITSRSSSPAFHFKGKLNQLSCSWHRVWKVDFSWKKISSLIMPYVIPTSSIWPTEIGQRLSGHRSTNRLKLLFQAYKGSGALN